ncbi:MAG: hypothetical protein PWP11_835 [Thauera sp.]|nr:DUF6631 family protein [Thauera sp.]MDI3489558.1 hypothetical protein [Thauera sp.]
MARKINRPDPAGPSAAAQEADDLDVLHPERVLSIGGRQVVVREYGNVEWLRLLPSASPLVTALAEKLGEGAALDYETALGVLAEHIDAVLPFVLQSADMDRAAFDALGADDAELLLMAWWGVNGRFFVQRAANRLGVAQLQAALARSAGANSTQPSSPTATAPQTSVATPQGS